MPSFAEIDCAQLMGLIGTADAPVQPDLHLPEDLAPQTAGLLAVSVGLSRAYRDDPAQLDTAMPLCDALYRWVRDGFDEGHDRPAGRAMRRKS